MINRCPHCDQRALSQRRKFAMWRASRVTCQACGKPVRLSGLDWLAVAPFLILGLVTASGVTSLDPMLLLGSGVVIFFVLRLVWVPLAAAE